MGQAKDRKKRLGEWYGLPIGPGHPDFVPPKKPERKPIARTETEQEESMHSEAVKAMAGVDRTREERTSTEPQSVAAVSPLRPKPRRLPGLFAAMLLATAFVGGASIPEPEHRPKKR